MIFESDTYALALEAEDPDLRRELSFHLLTCRFEEVKAHFHSTFQKIDTLRTCGYSAEKIQPYERALVKILLELRVRGYEADHSGHLYRSPSIIPIPKSYPLARERQKHRLRQLDPELFREMYTKTLNKLRSQVKKESKAVSF